MGPEQGKPTTKKKEKKKLKRKRVKEDEEDSAADAMPALGEVLKNGIAERRAKKQRRTQEPESLAHAAPVSPQTPKESTEKKKKKKRKRKKSAGGATTHGAFNPPPRTSFSSHVYEQGVLGRGPSL